MKLASALTTASLLLSVNLHADDWPQWRGPNRDDISKETGLLKKWPASGPKTVWINEDVGLGYSGYSIVDGTLYTMGARDAVEYVIAVDATTGKEKWSTEAGPLLQNKWGNGPRSTPTVSDGKVYAISGKGTLICLNAADGKEIWSTRMVEDLGGKLQSWGYTESPLVEGDLVVCTPGGSAGTMAAFEKSSGKKAWQTAGWDDVAQYASVAPAVIHGRRQLVQLTGKSIAGVAPEDGKVIWRHDFPGKTAVIPTPIVKGNQVFVSAGYGVGCMMVEISEDNQVKQIYANTDLENHHGGVILVGDHLYGHSNKGGWTCMEFATGQVVWTEKKAVGKGAIHCADGMFYLLDEKSGDVVLIEASPKGFDEKSRFTLNPQTSQRSPDGRVWTHPVVSGGRLFLRDQELLHCYDVAGK
ncbi:MAG: PQQ-like beta-propeller repeat protein [Verrucomicrobiales bacterium]|nr:PQQ-like beta-propeller repeat protein [Verrucomicrobiales bacterium]